VRKKKIFIGPRLGWARRKKRGGGVGSLKKRVHADGLALKKKHTLLLQRNIHTVQQGFREEVFYRPSRAKGALANEPRPDPKGGSSGGEGEERSGVYRWPPAKETGKFISASSQKWGKVRGR